MKKRFILLWVIGIILFIVSILYLLRLSQREEDFFLAETSESISETTEITDGSAQENMAEQAFLEDFGEDWLNFSSTSERKQKAEKYLTEDALSNSSIEESEENEHASTGRIKTITQDIQQPQKYVLIGEKTTRGETREIVLEVDITTDPSPKISHFDSSYKE